MVNNVHLKNSRELKWGATIVIMQNASVDPVYLQSLYELLDTLLQMKTCKFHSNAKLLVYIP